MILILLQMKKKIAMNSLYYKHILLVVVLLASFSTISSAAEIKESIDLNYLPNLLGDLLLVFGYIFAFFAITYLFRLLFMVLRLEKLRLMKEQGMTIVEEDSVASKVSWWTRMYKKMTQVVPVEKEADIMLDHNYDGIRELDNSLPPWWVAMFYISIFVGTAYFMYYHYYDMGQTTEEWYAEEMAYAEAQKARFLEKQANSVNEGTVVALTDEQALANGAAIFKNNCAACHGQLGEGGIGPNMTDEYWVHGGDIKSIFKTIKYGVPQKGMIAWKSQLRPSDIHQVASYIKTLVGTNPPNAKEPEGQREEPTPESTPAADSTSITIGMNN